MEDRELKRKYFLSLLDERGLIMEPDALEEADDETLDLLIRFFETIEPIQSSEQEDEEDN